MKARYIIGILFLFPGIIACAQRDTLNQTDLTCHKQGYRKNYDVGHGRNGLVSEGYYLNNRKTGKWTEYYNNGNIRDKLEFKNGRANGFATMYHENGRVSESGNFINNRWTGVYVSYNLNGRPEKVFFYNEAGKQNGHQIVYGSNGKITSESEYDNGKEIYFKSAYENGIPKEERLGDTLVQEFYETGNPLYTIHFNNNGKQNYTQTIYDGKGK